MFPRSVLTLRCQSGSGSVIQVTGIATTPMETGTTHTGTIDLIVIMVMALRTIGTTGTEFTVITVTIITTIATKLK